MSARSHFPAPSRDLTNKAPARRRDPLRSDSPAERSGASDEEVVTADAADGTFGGSGDPASDEVIVGVVVDSTSSTPRPTPEQAAHLEAWLDLLDKMEADLDRVQAMLGQEGALDVHLWQPTSAPPPFPPSLFPRARLIRERQIALADEINKKLTATRSEMALTDKVRNTANTDLPVYLDRKV